MIRRPPRATRTDTLFPYTTLFRSIGVAVTTARKLDLKNPDQLRTLDFDTTMTKYAAGYAGLKQLLAIYGLSVDDTLNSVKLSPVSNSNGHAVEIGRAHV